jgi:hypothetical protein
MHERFYRKHEKKDSTTVQRMDVCSEGLVIHIGPEQNHLLTRELRRVVSGWLPYLERAPLSRTRNLLLRPLAIWYEYIPGQTFLYRADNHTIDGSPWHSREGRDPF